jgi:glycosyltransferase involved in cell wall biosynthesis
MVTGPQSSNGSFRPRLELLRPGPEQRGQNGGAEPHVLLALDQFPKSLGGGERVVLRLAELLPEYGYRASILTLGVAPESSILTSPAPCPIYLLPMQRTYGPEAVGAALELRRLLREENVRIVQTFFESSDLWVGPVAKLMSDAKLAWSRRDMGILRGRKHRVAYRWMAKLPDRVFAVSEQVRRHCIDVDGVPANRVETLYNGLDLAAWMARAEVDQERTRPIIKTVGNIRRVKGHDVFLRAAAIVLREFPDAQFCIGGEVLEAEFFAELEELTQELGIGESVTFTGPVSDVCAYLQDARLFVLPSRSEGFSNAIIEAMSAALPVVATDVGGNAEAVTDGVTGRVVPPENADALAAAMIELLSDPERCREMGAAGRSRVAERFTTEAMMRQLVSAYESLIGAA